MRCGFSPGWAFYQGLDDKAAAGLVTFIPSIFYAGIHLLLSTERLISLDPSFTC